MKVKNILVLGEGEEIPIKSRVFYERNSLRIKQIIN